MESTVSSSVCEALCGPPLVPQPGYYYAIPLRAARRPIDARRRTERGGGRSGEVGGGESDGLRGGRDAPAAYAAAS